MKNKLLAIISCSTALGLSANAFAVEPAISRDVTFTLTALEEACEPYIEEAHTSLADADLAKYCITTGESIALSATKNMREKTYVQSVLNSWMDYIQPSYAAK